MCPERLPWPEAKRMVSFSEARLRIKARAIQLAPNVFQAAMTEAMMESHCGGSGREGSPWRKSGMLATTTDTNERPAAVRLGRMRFQGNGIGGGAEA